MQRYCTTAKNPHSEVPPDDGRSLLASDLYRLEVKQSHRFDVAEEHNLVQLARSGNQEARSLLIESCLGYIYGFAFKYSQKFSHVDMMDLAQVGNEAIVECFDGALKSRYPCAYLRVAARNVMIDYCISDGLIRVPATSYRCGKRAPLTVSLTAPLYDDDGRSLLDCLEDADWQGIKAGTEVMAHV